MPSPTIVCEFCESEMRKDVYANHVKAKHSKEISYLILSDFKECSINALASYAASKDPKSMRIESKRYESAEYWFGVKPHFYIQDSIREKDDSSRPDTKLKGYKEDLELTDYLKRSENLIAHKGFIEEVLKEISLFDFIQYQKDLLIRNPNIDLLKKELSSIKEEYKVFQESSKNEIERLKKEVENWKETADEKEFISDLKRDLAAARHSASRLEETCNRIKEANVQKNRDYEEHWAALNMSRTKENADNEFREDQLRSQIAEMKEKLEKQQVKIKSEAQKIVDKQNAEKQKAKEKKAVERAKAKKALKKLKKKAEAESDSDSNSDSDSD